MNRQIPYPGALPRSFDFSQSQQNAMIALGWLAQAVVGTSAWCSGLPCQPTTPASLSVIVGPGVLSQLTVVEQNPFGTTLPSDSSDPLMKIGVNIASTVMSALTAPVTSGQSQVWLLEGQMLEADGSPVVLPYVNPSNPSQPFAGPNNGGAAQNTQRTQTVSLQWVAGAPATSGTQTIPAATPGWVALYAVTLSNGQTSISASNIVVLPTAPFIQFTLPNLTPGFSRVVSFQTSGTFTVPAGVTRLRVRLSGGGGGGGSGTNPGSAGSGGGGAGYSEGVFSVVPGTNVAVTVGAAGIGSSGTFNGTPGGASSFGSLISATGGGGGFYSSGGGQTMVGSAGLGTGGAVNITGQSGGTGGVPISGTGFGGASGAAYSAAGASQSFGGGGTGATPGAGGGGGANSNNGGNGGSGLVIVEY